jgi:hypothetical protein
MSAVDEASVSISFCTRKRIVSLYLLILLLQSFRRFAHIKNLTPEGEELCDMVFRGPANIFISPDVGTYWGSSGYVDFFVDDDRSWAIVLLLDDQDASGHKSRFNSIYKPIKKISKEWAIIDIRCPGLRDDEPEYSGDRHWINVYCQENWESVIIEDEDEKVEVQLIGGEDTVENILS